MEMQLAGHFMPPCRADGTSIDAAGFARLLDEFYLERGWDLEFGWPDNALLSALGLDEVAAELTRLREDTRRAPS